MGCRTGAPLQTLEGHRVYVNTVSPDGKRLASTSETAKLWDAVSEAPLQTIEDDISYINAVAFSPDGRRLASASGGKTVRLWDTATGAHLQTLESHRVSINAVFSLDGMWLAPTSEKTVRLMGGA